MKTCAEIAQHPEMQAQFAALSPKAQRVADMLITLLDRLPASDAESVLAAVLGDDAPAPTYGQTRREAAAAVDSALAERFPEFNALSPATQRLAVAVEQHALAPEPPRRDDDPIITLIDDGERSGIRLERFDWDEGEKLRAWLDFTIGEVPGKNYGRVMVSVDIVGGPRPGLEIDIHGNQITSSWVDVPCWTLGDLRQLRDDLDRLLRDERLLGALAEQG